MALRWFLVAVTIVTVVGIVAIGGITIANAAEVIATGVDGICVVSAIAAAACPREAAAQLRALWEEA